MADVERKTMKECSMTKYNGLLVKNAFPAILILKKSTMFLTTTPCRLDTAGRVILVQYFFSCAYEIVYASRLFEVFGAFRSVFIFENRLLSLRHELWVNIPTFYPAEPWFYRMAQTAVSSTMNAHWQLPLTSFMSFHVNRVSVEP